jgi:hypothetical protein
MSLTLHKILQNHNKVVIVGTLPLGLYDNSVQTTIIQALANNERLHIKIIAETNTDLFLRSLSTDTTYSKDRISFATLRAQSSLLSEMVASYSSPLDDSQNDNVLNRRLELVYSFLPISLYVIQVDNTKLYVAPITLTMRTIEDYIELIPTDPLYPLVRGYIDDLQDPSKGGRFFANEQVEALQLYDQDKAPRGIFPRSSFYDTDYHQFVVWVFIFDRSGHMLIHLRGQNAKDNRNMWDKSVGGHVDWSRELSSNRTAVREIIEELFEDEINKETMAMFVENEDNIIFLGEWDEDHRGWRKALSETLDFKTQWAMFKYKEQVQTSTPRYFHDGPVRRLRVIADIFFVIANETLTDSRLKDFKNSAFRLVKPTQLKTEIATKAYIDKDGNQREFIATPDLENVMSSKISDSLDKFSQYVKFIFTQRE